MDGTQGGLEDARKDLKTSCNQSGSETSFESGKESCPTDPPEREYEATCKGTYPSGERVETFYYDLSMDERDQLREDCRADGFDWFLYVDQED